jgi:pilus assembly protein Flp/PilA
MGVDVFRYVIQRDRDERGATAVEYGLMVGLIAIVIVGGVSVFGIAVSDLFLVPAGVFGP